MSHVNDWTCAICGQSMTHKDSKLSCSAFGISVNVQVCKMCHDETSRLLTEEGGEKVEEIR
jgi:hypothetical protein